MLYNGSRPRCNVFLALLGLGIVACSATWAQAPLIAEVRVEGAGYVSADVVLDAVKDLLRPGVELTPELATRAQEKVMALGYYERVTISQRQTPQGLQVIISVVERQRIEKIVFVGNTVMSDEQLLAEIKSGVGRIADSRVARRDAQRIQDAYEKAGYSAQVSRADIDHFGVLTFVIDEARIEDFTISGLRHTKEWVVRRQINLKPGEIYQDRRIIENVQRIMDLQIFNKVEPAPRAGKLDPTAIIVDFKIEEAQTGRAQFAVAYSNLDRLVVMTSVQENNFRGEAERASLNVEVFGRTTFDITYVEPFWGRGGTSIEASIYDSERRRGFGGGASFFTTDDRFDERRSGGTLRVSRPLRADDRLRASVRLRTERVSTPYLQAARVVSARSSGEVRGSAVSSWWTEDQTGHTPDNPDLSPDVAGPGDLVGPIRVTAPLHSGGRLSSLTLGLSDDRRDSRLRTTRGTYSALTTEIAGAFLGGDADFRKVQAEHRRYYPVRSGKDVVALRLMGGTILGDAPLFEAFAVGGTNTLRGYREERFRGTRMLLGNLEYRHPVNESLTVVGFVDVGGAFGGEFTTLVPGFILRSEDQSFDPHVGVGVGMRVVTPLGPLRLDFGWGEEGSEAYIGFGQMF